VGGGASVYAHGYWSDGAHPQSAPSGRIWESVLRPSMGLVLLAAIGPLQFEVVQGRFLSAYGADKLDHPIALIPDGSTMRFFLKSTPN